jgi:hypothetical protein
MRTNLEATSLRVAILACGLAAFYSACGGGSSGGAGGQGGVKADGSAGGAGGLKLDGSTGTGASVGKIDASPDTGQGGAATDGGSGGQGGAATDGGAGGQGGAATDGGAGGASLSLPWHTFLPLGMAAPGSSVASGTTVDVTANGYDATYFGTTISFVNAALNLTGLTSELVLVPAKSNVPAVDVTGSYSVSVWATLASAGGFRTLVAGEGINVASFYLQQRADTNAWAFTVFPTDSIVGPACIVPGFPVDGGPARNPVTPVVNTTYHLVATRDATTNTNILYVNGVESGRGVCLAGWADTGLLGIGHGIFAGGRGDNVQGSLAELGLINRVLTPVEVANLFAMGRAGMGAPDAGVDTGVDAGAGDHPIDAPSDTGIGTDTAASDAPADLAADGV